MNRIQRDFAGVDAADNSRFTLLLLYWKDVPIVVRMLSVLPRNPIEVIERSRFNELSFPTDFDVARCILGIDDQQGHFGVGPHVPAFLAFTGRVDAGTLAILVAPYQARLRLAVGHDGRQRGNARAIEQVIIGFGNSDLHKSLALSPGNLPPEYRIGEEGIVIRQI